MSFPPQDHSSPRPVDHRSERQVVLFLAFLSIILAFGVDSILPAFDNITEQFNSNGDPGAISLVITWYLLGMAAGQLFWGLLADRFGRRTILLVGLTMYGVGALGSGLATSMNVLLLMRFIWGLGGASPSVIRLAIARDLYGGAQMARVISFMMAIFLLGPAVAPAIGQSILWVGDWRLVCFAAFPLAVLGAFWTVRFGESLPPSQRRPIDLAATSRGVRTVCRTRLTMGYTLASMFTFGAFFVYLGSSATIIDRIYGLDRYFALIFGVSSLFLAAAVWISERFTRRFGSDFVSLTSVLVLLVISTVFTFTAVFFDGVPPFWIWFIFVAALGAFTTVFTPNAGAVAMEPMQKVAGAASGVYGVITIGGGSIIASFVDRQIQDTVTPMAVGNVVYTAVAIALVLWARGGSYQMVDPDHDSTSSTVI